MIPLTLIGAMLGASLASFGALLSYRVRRGVSIVRPRSTCASCATGIAWHDNVPVVSYLVLAGRCRTCRTSIPLTLLIVEIAGAVSGGVTAYAALRT